MSSYLNDPTGRTTTRSDDPEVIRRDIESTRADLSRNVDALTEKVSPARVVGRNVDQAKGAVGSVKEKRHGLGRRPLRQRALGSAADKASSVASSVGDTATAAPSVARQKTQGNPLAAGLIAFGVGWLASSLLPATEKEQQAASCGQGQGERALRHADRTAQGGGGRRQGEPRRAGPGRGGVGEGHGDRRRCAPSRTRPPRPRTMPRATARRPTDVGAVARPSRLVRGGRAAACQARAIVWSRPRCPRGPRRRRRGPRGWRGS